MTFLPPTLACHFHHLREAKLFEQLELINFDEIMILSFYRENFVGDVCVFEVVWVEFFH